MTKTGKSSRQRRPSTAKNAQPSPRPRPKSKTDPRVGSRQIGLAVVRHYAANGASAYDLAIELMPVLQTVAEKTLDLATGAAYTDEAKMVLGLLTDAWSCVSQTIQEVITNEAQRHQ